MAKQDEGVMELLRVLPKGLRLLLLRRLAGENNRGLSQEDVANHVGVTRTAVTAWELGDANPKPQHYLRLARLFDVPAEVLMEDVAEPKSDEAWGDPPAETTELLYD
jgi:transcriptional regulator with XRE-family HTH domain